MQNNSYYQFPGKEHPTLALTKSSTAGAELGNAGLFTSKGYSPDQYVQSFSPNTLIWSQQRVPPIGWNNSYFGNYPDPILSYRMEAGTDQIRKMARKWQMREERSYRQMRFNYLESGTDTSHMGTREDTQENYSYQVVRAPFQEALKNEWVILGAIILVYFLFKS